MPWEPAALLLLGGSTALMFLGVPVAISFLAINIVGAILFLGGQAGLQPAQPAVPLLDRDDPPAAGALAAVIAAGEVITGPAVRPRAI